MSDTDRLITLDEIEAAARRIGPYITRTPLVPMFECGVKAKAENLQPSGSFKLRGAFNTLLQLTDAQRSAGVVAHSSGNHAVAVAQAAQALGIAATIVMPVDAPDVKVRRTRSCGATVEIVGAASVERMERAHELATQRGLVPIEPYDQHSVLSATATIALEILDDLDAVGDPGPIEVYVPISGGGLSGGVAAGMKLGAGDRSVRVIGVEPELAADALASWRAGQRVALPADDMARTVADGLRVQQVGERPWRHLRAFLDDIVTVSELEIRRAVGALVDQAWLVAEPSGAVSVAAAMRGARSDVPPDRRIAVVTGGNVDRAWFSEVMASVP